MEVPRQAEGLWPAPAQSPEITCPVGHAGLLRVHSAGLPAGKLLKCAPQAGSLVLGNAHLRQSYMTGQAAQLDPATSVETRSDLADSPLLNCAAGLSCLPLKRAAPSDTGIAGAQPEESSLTPASPTFMKARTRVTAFKASKEAVIEAMHKYPELAEALQNKVWQHRSDQAVAEAISALHLPLLGRQGT